MKTTSAVLDGVDVITQCRDAGSVGVIAHGRRQPPAVVGDGAAHNHWADDVRARTQAELGSVVVGVGWGLGCRDGAVGPTVYVGRYGDIDATVARLAAFARREDLGVPFVVMIASAAA